MQKFAVLGKLPRIALAALLLFAASRAGAQPISPAQKTASVPVKYRRAVSLLTLLARSQGRRDGDGFAAHKVAFSASDVARIVSLVSARGVVVVDANEYGGKARLWSKAKLRGDLARTGSSAFDSFAYAGYIFAQPYVQYSKLRALPLRDGVVIEMAWGHRFTWAREQGHLQLRKLEYLQIEGE